MAGEDRARRDARVLAAADAYRAARAAYANALTRIGPGATAREALLLELVPFEAALRDAAAGPEPGDPGGDRAAEFAALGHLPWYFDGRDGADAEPPVGFFVAAGRALGVPATAVRDWFAVDL